MSISSEITRISNNVQNTIDTIEATGVTVPEGANSDGLPSLAQALANTKQDKLTGAEGQIVGFDESGNAVAQEAPSGLPTGGTPGQMLYQGASGPEWGDKPDAQQIDFTPGSTGLTADNVQDAIEELNDKLPAISLASATLYSGSWTLSGGKYAQTVQISGVTASARLILPDPDTPGDDQQADEEVLQAWGAGPAKIEPSAGNGTVTFYSWTQPTINIPIQVVVIT